MPVSRAQNGKPATHAKAVELIATLTAGAVDHYIESKGLDEIDREKAKHKAKKDAERYLEHNDKDIAPGATAPDVGAKV